MLVIRLRRIGRKHDPHYRVVVTEHTSPVQGKFIAEIGNYHPKSKEIAIDQAKFLEWVNKGAKASNTVARLAIQNKIEHKNVTVKQLHGQPKKKAVEAAAAKADTANKPAPAAEPVVSEEVEADAPETEEVTPDAEASAEETTEEPAETEEDTTEEKAAE